MYVLDFEIYNEFAELHCNHTLKKPVIYVVEEDAMNAKIIDVGIITIVSTEIQALLNIFHADINDWEEIGMQRYYHASVFSEQVNRELSIVITSPKREGNTNCAITTTKFLYDWYPRIICLVGIGAGIRGKIRIGDVILPKKIHDYTVKKYERRKYTPRSESMDWPDCIDNMLKYHPFNERAFAETCEKELDKDILDARYKAERLLSSRGVAEDFNYIITTPRINDGNLISDNVLIRDERYFGSIISGNDDKCQGADMESAGFVKACQRERIDFPWVVVRGISDYGDVDKSNSFQLLAAKSACIALRELLQHSINIDELKPNPKAIELEESLQFDMIKHIKEAYKNKDWDTVCIAGPILSRYLYLSSQYELQIRIGELVEDSALMTQREELRAKCLIDDIGWTLYMYGSVNTKRENEHRAKAHIQEGLQIAKKIKEPYMCAKACRHLASIDRRAGRINEAEEKLSKADSFAQKIPEQSKQTEIKASLHLSHAKLLAANKMDDRYEECIKEAQEAVTLFTSISDQKRAIKCYSFIGDIYTKMGQKDKAIESFQTGLKRSLETHRYDSIKENGEALIGMPELPIADKVAIVCQIKAYCHNQHLQEEMIYWNRLEKGLRNDEN